MLKSTLMFKSTLLKSLIVVAIISFAAELSPGLFTSTAVAQDRTGFNLGSSRSERGAGKRSTDRKRVGTSKVSPLRALLTKRVTEPVNFEDTPLSDVFEWLRAQGSELPRKINVIPRWKALSTESIDEDSPVTLQMEDTTVAEVLNEVLDQVSDVDPVRYLGSGNTLRISTKTDFDRKLYTRIYNIEDIFFEVENFFGSPQINLQQQQQQGGGGGGGANTQVQSVFGQQGGGGGNQNNQNNDEDDDERIDEILEWIRQTVEPESWVDNGGDGSIDVFNRQLIVRNNVSVHEILGGPFYLDE